MPIIVTGNDLSTLFAPLVRDGRMAKFYWEPSRSDLQHILHQMYKVPACCMQRAPGYFCCRWTCKTALQSLAELLCVPCAAL